MAEFRITCLRWGTAPGTHVGITHLGGEGRIWTREEVVRAIESGEHSFYVLVRGRRIPLAVVPGALARYVRARVNGLWTDDLLALPQCDDR